MPNLVDILSVLGFCVVAALGRLMAAIVLSRSDLDA
jgi:hypothetical protein